MVSRRVLFVVLLSSLLFVSLALSRYSSEGDSFTGLCVYSSGGFSLLYNGSSSVAVNGNLELGKVYTVTGRLKETPKGLWMDVSSLSLGNITFPLETLEGAYWMSYYPQLLTPARVRLAYPLNVFKGELARVEGLSYGDKFYPLRVERLGYLKEPRDGMPYLLRGVVLRGGNPAEVWNGSEAFRVYLPHSVSLKPGFKVEVLGIVRLYSTITIYVNAREDVQIPGTAEEKPVERARVGEIAVGRCLVVGKTSRYLKLNCTKLGLYGFTARVGDEVQFKALRRESSLLCLDCSIVKSREELSNGICHFEEGNFAKISGKVAWVRVYKNGFGIANVTNGSCSILLKLPSRLGVSVVENENVTAYGVFTTYRGRPAFEVNSGDDICSGRHC